MLHIRLFYYLFYCISISAFCRFKLCTIFYIRDTRWHSWLRHCATSRKVAGSIPDGVIGIFH